MPPPVRFKDVLPSTWQDVSTFEIDPATQAVTLTRAGESWARDQGAKIGADTYQLTLDNDTGLVTFNGFLVAAPEEYVARGLEPNWFRGVGAKGETLGDVDVSGL